MSQRTQRTHPAFRVIEGGLRAPRPLSLPGAAPIVLGAPELAGDMAEMFALALMRHVPVQALGDPHSVVEIDGTTRFTLHELLCELRNLSWFDASAAPQAAVAVCSRTGLGEAGHRRQLRWNGDGQLTLRTLFRGGVMADRPRDWLSPLLSRDICSAQGVEAGALPGEDQPVSDWIRWCAAHNGSGLRLPGDPRPTAPESLAALAARVAATPASRPFFNAALAALGAAVPMQPGLAPGGPAGGRWGAGRVFRLLAEAETHARRAALARHAQIDRPSRPAVTAARMAVYLGREELSRGGPEDPVRQAADELAQAAPNLLAWVSRANTALRGAPRCAPSLFLPLVGPEDAVPDPSDTATHLVVAGALATLLKAVFATPQQRLQSVGTPHPGHGLDRECDLLCSDYALARVVAASAYPSENHADLRLGQAIALELLRDALVRDAVPARLSLRDFDGRALSVVAQPGATGPVRVQLVADGRGLPWPQ